MNRLEAALLAQQCYTDTPTIGLENTASRAVVYPGNVIAIPGSNNIACWLADLDIATTSTLALGRLHAGFWGSYSAIASELMDLSPEVIVGHSEGAAIALIYAAALCLMKRPPKQVFAFEPPRCTTDGTMREVFISVGLYPLLTHNGDDLVPCVPRVTADWQQPWGITELCSTKNPYPQISDDWLANIEDHLMTNVIATIKKEQ